MKKIIAIVLGIIMITSIFMFTSCEKDEDTTTIVSPNDESTVSVDESIVDSTEVTPVSSEEVTESDTNIEVDPPVDSETDTSAVG